MMAGIFRFCFKVIVDPDILRTKQLFIQPYTEDDDIIVTEEQQYVLKLQSSRLSCSFLIHISFSHTSLEI